jgi:hypothetical protein
MEVALLPEAIAEFLIPIDFPKIDDHSRCGEGLAGDSGNVGAIRSERREVR